MLTLSPQLNAVVIVALGVLAFAVSLLVRRVVGERTQVNTAPWASTLS